MTTGNELATIEVRCIPDNPNAISGILNTKKVRFDIETKNTGETIKRIPLNLVLILDRSGSMASDNKLTFAKKAVVSVLNLLHDDDIIHFVVYDSDVSIIFENARASSRQYLYPLIDEIQTAGATNMSGGLNVGADLLDKYVYDGFSSRMFLFSDGQANVGMSTRAELTNLVRGYNNKGIITDAFGIGADFDSEIMKGIADAGGSRFYFLERAQVIEPLVSKAVVSVFGVCGSHARLTVRGKNGAIVTKIWGHEDIVAGASLGDLHSPNLRSVLCEFTTSGTVNADGTEMETLTYTLQYNRPNDLNGEPTVIKNTLSLKFVEDESLVREIDPRVKTMFASQMAADVDKKIAQLVRDGKRNEAIDVATEQIALLEDAERFDDERGSISLLLQLARKMHKKLKDESINSTLVCRGYEHQAYLKEECDEEDMGFGLFD
jgi:Ca-activated chloride channel family protein